MRIWLYILLFLILTFAILQVGKAYLKLVPFWVCIKVYLVRDEKMYYSEFIYRAALLKRSE